MPMDIDEAPNDEVNLELELMDLEAKFQAKPEASKGKRGRRSRSS